ncbi:MAG: glycosyl transferase, partial [Glutamicibacter sp.]
NREVAQAAGEYFNDPQSASRLFDRTESKDDAVRQRAQLARKRASDYDWDDVARAYEKLCLDLAGAGEPSVEFDAVPSAEIGRRRA